MSSGAWLATTFTLLEASAMQRSPTDRHPGRAPWTDRLQERPAVWGGTRLPARGHHRGPTPMGKAVWDVSPQRIEVPSATLADPTRNKGKPS